MKKFFLCTVFALVASLSSFAGQGAGNASDYEWKINNRLALQLDGRGLIFYQRTHVIYEELFKQVPQLNAILDGNISTAGGNTYADSAVNAAFLATNLANKDFEILGTNMTSALVTFAGKFDAGAGIKITTAGADADGAIIVPHLNTKQTSWAASGQFSTRKRPLFACSLCPSPAALITTVALTSNVVTVTTDIAHGIPTGASVTIKLDESDSDYDSNMASTEGTFTVTAGSSTTLTYSLTHANISSASIAGSAIPTINYKQIIWAGFKLTNTATVTTDINQAFFRFDTSDTANGTNWHFITSRANVDVDDVLGVPCVPGIAYDFVLKIDSARRPHPFINGVDLTDQLSAAGQAALVTDVSLIPYIGTQAVGTTPAAKSITVWYEAAGRRAGSLAP